MTANGVMVTFEVAVLHCEEFKVVAYYVILISVWFGNVLEAIFFVYNICLW